MKKITKRFWIITISYFVIYLIFLTVKSAPSFSFYEGNYLNKLSYGVNIIPFQFDRNTPLNYIILLLIFKFLKLMPLSYAIYNEFKFNSTINYIEWIGLISLLLEFFELIILKGYFDTTDIVMNCLGAITILMFIRRKK